MAPNGLGYEQLGFNAQTFRFSTYLCLCLYIGFSLSPQLFIANVVASYFMLFQVQRLLFQVLH